MASGGFGRPTTVPAGQIRAIGANFVVLYDATMPVEPTRVDGNGSDSYYRCTPRQSESVIFRERFSRRS